MIRLCNITIVFGIILFSVCVPYVNAQNPTNVDAYRLLSRVNVFLSPKTGTFVEGSTFDVPILINTKGRSINGIEITVHFDKNKLSVIRPAGGTSIIGVWVEPPSYDNTRGLVRYVGVIPNGITTESGLIGNITFQAKSVGQATVSFAGNSKILLNDGLGTESIVEFDRGSYNITPKAPLGVVVFSDTHPFQSDWYNNNSPVLSWDQDTQVEGFSYVMDNIPNTIPPNEINTNATTKSFEGLTDGLWYFHIKANKQGIWGTTGHFLVRIDTVPPAVFKPEVNYLLAAVALVDRTLVSFFTTDNLSGVDHYEVGVIDKKQPVTVSPIFEKAESPYQVPLTKDGELRVIVRAIDKAGNIRDVSINVAPPFLITKFIQDNIVYILLAIILMGFFGLLLHYLVGHHILRNLRRFRAFVTREEKENEQISKKN
ncbi:MAG: cohesin domain-containing protein [bacterium]|nr:cohesin domain-containing protein [bacterium]